MIYKVKQVHLNGIEKPLPLGIEVQISTDELGDFREDAAKCGILASNPYSANAQKAMMSFIRQHGSHEIKAFAFDQIKNGFAL